MDAQTYDIGIEPNSPQAEQLPRLTTEELDRVQTMLSEAMAKSEYTDEEKEQLREELAELKKEAVKIQVEGVQPIRHFSTNLVPLGVPFKLAKSQTRYVRIKEKSDKPGAGSLRRLNPDGSIRSRNRTVRGNAAKSLERITRSGNRRHR